MRAALILALLLCSCGPTVVEVKMIDDRPKASAGPKATPEELREEVPPLRGLWQPDPLVPPKLVPPEPPPDPDPDPSGF